MIVLRKRKKRAKKAETEAAFRETVVAYGHFYSVQKDFSEFGSSVALSALGQMDRKLRKQAAELKSEDLPNMMEVSMEIGAGGERIFQAAMFLAAGGNIFYRKDIEIVTEFDGFEYPDEPKEYRFSAEFDVVPDEGIWELEEAIHCIVLVDKVDASKTHVFWNGVKRDRYYSADISTQFAVGKLIRKVHSSLSFKADAWRSTGPNAQECQRLASQS